MQIKLAYEEQTNRIGSCDSLNIQSIEGQPISTIIFKYTYNPNSHNYYCNPIQNHPQAQPLRLGLHVMMCGFELWNFECELIWKVQPWKFILFILFKLQKTMVKKEPNSRSPHPTPAVFPSRPQLSQIKVLEEEYYFEESIAQKKELSARQPSQIHCSGSKQIKKERRPKKHNPEDRFLKEHQKNYYLFPFLYYTENPFFKISWGQWKPNSIYKKMAATLSQSPLIPPKTSIQCKSFDQRMKNEHFINPPSPKKKDLLESSLSYLQTQALLEPDLKIIQNYVGKMSEKSPYMSFLEQSVQTEMTDLEKVKLDCELKKEESYLTDSREANEILFNEFFDSF